VRRPLALEVWASVTADRFKERRLSKDARPVLKHVAVKLDVADAKRFVGTAAGHRVYLVVPSSLRSMARLLGALLRRHALGALVSAVSSSGRLVAIAAVVMRFLTSSP
jgi:hypothetical protein